MILLSIACAVLFAAPDWLVSATVIVASVLFAAVFTSGIVYGTGDVRAFCIGALFPTTLIVITAGRLFGVITFELFETRNPFRNTDDIFQKLALAVDGMRFDMVVGCLLTPIAGLITVVVRRTLQTGE